MNAAAFTRHVKAGARAAETHVPALERGYRATLRQAGRDAAAAFQRTATALTAATNPSFTPPEEQELIDADKLAADAKKRTAGAHRRALRAVMDPALADAQISFDVKNPLIARQFEKLGVRAQDLGVAVRAQIANAIRDAYNGGLSIPDTADRIVQAVDGISDTRAMLLARTDMIGLVNGGSLAAAQLVDMPFKQWLTAQDERVRDSHADADGQTVAIDQPFDVGGASLDYPGDPDGPDEEVFNCRCTLVYVESADATVASAGNQPDPALASGGLMDASPAVTAAVTITLDDQGDGTIAAGGAAWEAVLCVEGEPTEDGRLLEIGSTEWRDTPMTLMVLFETGPGGHEGAVIGGRIDRIWRDETDQRVIRGAGVFDTGDDGQEAQRLVANETLRGVSIDPVVTEYEYRDRETGRVLEGDDLMQAIFDDRPILFVYLRHTIVAATVCNAGAIANAGIMLASGALHAAWYTEWQRPVPITAAAKEPVAPLHPPREWFDTAEPPGLMPLTITDEGRVFGHIADWSTCHTGVAGVCTTAPHSPSGYAYFHVGELATAEGDRVAVGKIMLGAKHAPLSASRLAASEHYDDNGTVGAYVRATDGEHGIWVCGAVRHDLEPTRLAEFRANPPSGDWRGVNYRLELIAALAVPVPGFPVPRAQAELLASAGEIEIPSLILSSGRIDPTRDVVAALVAAGIADEALLEPSESETDARVRTLAVRAESDDPIAALAALAES
jgi:hypothetical protein